MTHLRELSGKLWLKPLSYSLVTHLIEPSSCNRCNGQNRIVTCLSIFKLEVKIESAADDPPKDKIIEVHHSSQSM